MSKNFYSFTKEQEIYLQVKSYYESQCLLKDLIQKDIQKSIELYLIDEEWLDNWKKMCNYSEVKMNLPLKDENNWKEIIENFKIDNDISSFSLNSNINANLDSNFHLVTKECFENFMKFNKSNSTNEIKLTFESYNKKIIRQYTNKVFILYINKNNFNLIEFILETPDNTNDIFSLTNIKESNMKEFLEQFGIDCNTEKKQIKIDDIGCNIHVEFINKSFKKLKCKECEFNDFICFLKDFDHNSNLLFNKLLNNKEKRHIMYLINDDSINHILNNINKFNNIQQQDTEENESSSINESEEKNLNLKIVNYMKDNKTGNIIKFYSDYKFINPRIWEYIQKFFNFNTEVKVYIYFLKDNNILVQYNEKTFELIEISKNIIYPLLLFCFYSNYDTSEFIEEMISLGFDEYSEKYNINILIRNQSNQELTDYSNNQNVGLVININAIKEKSEDFNMISHNQLINEKLNIGLNINNEINNMNGNSNNTLNNKTNNSDNNRLSEINKEKSDLNEENLSTMIIIKKCWGNCKSKENNKQNLNNNSNNIKKFNNNSNKSYDSNAMSLYSNKSNNFKNDDSNESSNIININNNLNNQNQIITNNTNMNNVFNNSNNNNYINSINNNLDKNKAFNNINMNYNNMNINNMSDINSNNNFINKKNQFENNNNMNFSNMNNNMNYNNDYNVNNNGINNSNNMNSNMYNMNGMNNINIINNKNMNSLNNNMYNINNNMNNINLKNNNINNNMDSNNMNYSKMNNYNINNNMNFSNINNMDNNSNLNNKNNNNSMNMSNINNFHNDNNSNNNYQFNNQINNMINQNYSNQINNNQNNYIPNYQMSNNINNLPNQNLNIEPIKSVVQCLFECKSLTNYFLNPSKYNEYTTFPDAFPITAKYAIIVNEAMNNPIHSKKLFIEFKSLIEKKYNLNLFDPKEILIYILETIHQENKIPSENNNNYNQSIPNTREQIYNFFLKTKFMPENTTIISNNFFGGKEIIKECLGCKNLSYEYEIFKLIEFPIEDMYGGYILNKAKMLILENKKLNILKNEFMNNRGEKKINIHELFYYYVYCQKEKNENFICSKCGYQSMPMKYNYKFTILPNNLCLVLSRKRDTKINIKVNVVENIELPFFNQSKKYELIGIISYNAETNNYFSMSKSRLDNQWYLYKDDNISSFNIINVYNYGIPYILFYQVK